jgi:preprotein translocase subunit SecB
MINVNENSRPHLNIIKQYIKDLSYENPQTFDLIQSQQILSDVSININASFQSYNNDVFGVSLKIICFLNLEKNNIFHLDLDYCGFFKIMNKKKYNQEELTSEGARLIYPFAKSIIANITQNGGSLPILLDNIDFNTLQKVNS